MNRREVLQQVAWLMGGAISAPAVLGVLNGCTPKQGATGKLLFLSEQQAPIVAEVAEIIIPRTDTPGAKDVGVPAFIDLMLHSVYPKKDRDRFLSGLEAFEEEAVRTHGRSFMKLGSDDRLNLVQTLHDAAAAQERKLELPPRLLERPFILMMKELTMLGFFTSQVGATQVLQYAAVPGAYQPCLPLEKAGNGRTWALETSLRF